MMRFFTSFRLLCQRRPLLAAAGLVPAQIMVRLGTPKNPRTARRPGEDWRGGSLADRLGQQCPRGPLLDPGDLRLCEEEGPLDRGAADETRRRVPDGPRRAPPAGPD